MLSHRPLLAATIAAGLFAAAPAAGAWAGAPTARASGGDVPPVIPATIRTRIKRTQRALDRLSDYVDDGDAARVERTGGIIRRRVSATWRGAKYYIKHAPKPAADDARAGALNPSADEARARARISGGGGGARTKADPPTAALAVFQLQDDVISEIVDLTDGADAALVGTLRKTLSFTLDVRDAAVEDVHAIAPPAADDDRADVEARASGDGEAATFDTTMPEVAQMLDDELQQIDELRSDTADPAPGVAGMLRDAEAQIVVTRRTVNAYWPPEPADD